MKKVLKTTSLFLLLSIGILIFTGIYFDIQREKLEIKYATGASQFLDLPDGARIHFRDERKTDKPAIVLLHGYGGDGKDISMLSLNWKRQLPNTIFICPNGHEPCEISPSGYQWFDLTKDDPDYIIEKSIIAENKIQKFINAI